MKEWAKKEIELAIEDVKKNTSEDDILGYGYMIECYKSALRAYESLIGDGHSGMSISVTRQILNNLLTCTPLTPIEDIPEIWVERGPYSPDDIGKYVEYQCTRKPSLFKKVFSDGNTVYRDIDRFLCVDVSNKSATYHSKLVDNVMHEIIPIEMPYYPTKPRTVMCEDFLVDLKNGDFDTKGILYLMKGRGIKQEINRFFKEGEDGEWVEITKKEYLERKAMRVDI